MNIWIQRSLGAAAVTGGLLFAGATAANADDTTQESTNDSSSSISGPIEIGGIDLGLSSSSTSSHSSESTTTDGDRTVTESDSGQSASERSTGLSTGPISIDPSAMLDRSSETSSRQTDTGLDRSSSESASETSGSASAPIHVGGLQLTHESAGADHEASSETVTDGDRSSTQESASTEETHRQAGLGIGALDLDPGAAFDRSSTSSRDSAEAITDDRNSSSNTDAAASLPISFEGITGGFASATERTDEDSSTVTDGDRSSSESTSTTDSSHREFGFDGGGFAIAPGFAFTDERSSASEELGRDGDLSSDWNSSQPSFEGSAPYWFEGFDGWFASEDHSTREHESTIRDGDRAVSEREWDESHSANGVWGTTGEFTGHPAFGFDQSSTSERDRLGDFVTRDEDSSARGWFAWPFEYTGAAFGGDFLSADEQGTERTIVDGDRSTTETETSSDARSVHPVFGFDGIVGDPAGEFSTDDMSFFERF